MIVLSHLSPFAEGQTRWAYEHPDDPGLCLKIEKPGAEQKKLRRYSYRRFLPRRRHYSPNNAEWRGYRRAEKMGDESVWRHIPRFHGFVDTDLGAALVVNLIRNADGSVASSLRMRLREGVDDSLRRAFDEYKAFILHSGFSCTEFGNILVARLADGNERLYFAECKYRRPGLTFLPFLLTRRLRRKIAFITAKFAKHAPAAD